jgi:FtsZ-binding cell division protein ZapB
VAITTDMSGTATADEINTACGLEKEVSFGAITCATFLGSLMVAGLFIVLAPMPGHADDDRDKDRHRGPEDNDKGIHAEIAALQAQVAALQDQVNTLQDQVNTLQTANTDQQKEINSLQTSNTTLQKQLATVQSNRALLLGPFVNVDPNPEIGVIGPNIIFSGANIHIVSGSGRTNDKLVNGSSTGLGNLIIGYDEDPSRFDLAIGGGAPPPSWRPWWVAQLGDWAAHRFTQAAFGGLVAGELNTISNRAASVSGGFSNTASGEFASVSGGDGNTASVRFASVTGGHDNNANGSDSVILGDQFNFVGSNGAQSVVLGGQKNFAGGFQSVVLGGQGVTANKDNSIAPNPPFP